MDSRNFFLFIMLCACFNLALAEEDDFDKLTFYGFTPETPAAQRGLTHIFNGDAFHNAIPTKTLSFLQKLMLQGTYSPKLAFKIFGDLPSPPNRHNATLQPALSMSIFSRKDAEGQTYSFSNTNCFQCHAGVVRGNVIAGLGNAHVDQVALGYLVNKIVQYTDSDAYEYIPPILSPLEKKLLREFNVEIKSKIAPTYNQAISRGENFGPLAIWFQLKDLVEPSTYGLQPRPLGEKTDFDYLFYDNQGKQKPLPPVDPNPWWLYKYKKTIYRYADAVPDFHKAAHFAVNFTSIHPEVNEDHASHVAVVKEVLKFVKQTSSPPFPHLLNAALVKQGDSIFHGKALTQAGTVMKCASCHGSYTKNPAFQNYALPGGWFVDYKDTVKDPKTDPAYNHLLQSYAPVISHLAGITKFFDKEELLPIASVPTDKGYIAPPLDSIWASAPFFHNGSVPTLEEVLNSKLRPEYWQRNNDNPFVYNFEEVGLSYRIIAPKDYDLIAHQTKELFILHPEKINFRSIYVTRAYGRGNKGHLYGDTLTREERLAVIEFLKSLSGPDMKPIS